MKDTNRRAFPSGVRPLTITALVMFAMALALGLESDYGSMTALIGLVPLGFAAAEWVFEFSVGYR